LTADGSFYVARMLLSISSKRVSQHLKTDSGLGAKSGTLLNLATVNYNIGATSEFIAYVVINEATMLDTKYRNDMLSFKLSVGELFIKKLLV
jgi:hypothetical protein